MDDITIDRLVLDIPGLTKDQAQELSQRVGDGLADASVRNGSSKEVSVAPVMVDLNDEAVSRNLPRLADMIVDSILRQIG